MSEVVAWSELISQGRAGCRAALLKLEEDYIERQCTEIAKHKPDLVITEKGLSDLAMHFLTKAGISAIRRLRKTDNNRIARATGATIVHRRAPSPLLHADSRCASCDATSGAATAFILTASHQDSMAACSPGWNSMRYLQGARSVSGGAEWRRSGIRTLGPRQGCLRC